MSSATPQTTGPPLRVLCIDGGGVRGLSTLLILEDIMERIKELEGLSQVPSPCDRFDFIGGMGTGGVIAIMLGRLKMSVDQSIEAYKRLASSVFAPESTPSLSSSNFSAKKLEMAIKQMICDNCTACLLHQESSGFAASAHTCPHEDMLFTNEHDTKTAVLAMTKANVETLPTILTTYNKYSRLAGCKVWEVARATSAAVNFFDSIKLGRDGIEFVDASYGYSNPSEVLIEEAKKQFPDREMVVLSLGTGLGDVVEISDSKDSVITALLKMATTSKHTDLRLRNAYGNTGVYHRFNVENGLRDTTILDCHNMSKISAHTINYLNENAQAVKRFVAAFTMRARHNEKDKECLADLHVTDPRTDKKEIESKKGGLLAGCCQWIIEHKDFQRFLKEEESQILWIKGDPGKGKTMLLCGIINALELDNSGALSYFFCQATSNQLNTATSVLRGLIYHLALHNPQLTKHVRAKYDYVGKKLFSNGSVWHELCEIMTNMLNDPSLDNVTMIIDALDECSIGRDDLLEFIVKPSRAKWIVSSRNWSDIEDILEDTEQKVKIQLEINQHSVSAAVNSYIKLKVEQLAQKKKYDDDMKMTVLQHLHLNANGTFLWVALVCQELSNANARKKDIKNTLKLLPPGLDPLYQRMLEHILKSKDAHLYQDILAQVLIVYRPITLDELHILVEALEDLEKEDVKHLLTSCGSFLTVHNDVVSFVHQSARDYFVEKAADKIIPSGIHHQHQQACLRSLAILSKKLKRDIYGLQAPGCFIDEVSVPEPDPMAAIQYSCIFWVDHLCDSASNGVISKNHEVLSVFFKKQYLHWLEALSLLRSISVAGRAMDRLVSRLGKGSEDLHSIVKDARRFLMSHVGLIEVAPLQVYVSAIIFSPTSSLIRQTYRHEEPDWIDLKGRVDASWDACLQTLEGHDGGVTSVIFSSDGRRLVSGSDDKTAKIWDATSGTCLQTLEGHHNAVTSVMLSNDGQKLASGSGNKTVKVWDATSGVCLHTLKGRDNWATPVVFSNCGQRLASGSSDKTVKIWDTTSGACLQTLKRHHANVSLVVFSSDGQRLASGSRDMAVKVWNANSGACLQTLKRRHDDVRSVGSSNDIQRPGSKPMDLASKVWDTASSAYSQTLQRRDAYVSSMAFSKDGQQLALGSEDMTVTIWDVTSGTCLQTLRGHHGSVTSVAFSNDGQRLASGSLDATVMIWDATSGVRLLALKGHRGLVTSLVFSKDGQRLVSGSRDKTVKIWDATSIPPLPTSMSNGEFVKSAVLNCTSRLLLWSKDMTVNPWNATLGAPILAFKGHSYTIRSVAFSNNGQRLASGSDDKTAKIWDATSGACLQTLRGHSNYVTSVVFSHDGRQLATGSEDMTVKIWDVASGVCLRTLKGHDSWVISVMFSNDGQRLVSGSEDKVVKIWDAASGACRQTLEGHDSWVTSVVFSNDGRRLLSESDDKTVKIWNMTSGTCLQTLGGHESLVTSVVFSSDGHRLASASWDKTVKIWDAASGACLQTLEGHVMSVISAVLSNDGQRLASGSDDKTVRIWDATTGVCLHTLKGHRASVASVTFSHDGQRLASGSNDKTVKIWEATTGVCMRTFKGHDDHVTSVLFSSDGRRLASGSWDKTAKIWDVASGACLRTFKGHEDYVTSVVFSSCGRRLASGSRDKTIKIWDATSGACLQTLKGHDSWVTSVVFSNDGQLLASGSNAKGAKIWDVTSGACLRTLKGHRGSVTSVAFSNNGQQLASGSLDATVKIWDPSSGDCLGTLDGHQMIVTSVVFSNDGQRLASGLVNNRLKIWDPTSGAYLQTSVGHDDYLTSVAFSSDGQQLASGSHDKTIKIWDATSGVCLRTLNGHDQAVTSVLFSNNGRQLMSASWDNTVKMWDATYGECQETIRAQDSLATASAVSTSAQSASTSNSHISFPCSKFHSCSISSDGFWFMENQKRMIWLPPSYRSTTIAASPNMVALGYDSGCIIVIGIRHTN
ncbi:Vegetative incompatibility protein HET-E-1 [Ceratocystis lukuohia]|uniref:Vegetative incompatibility protein HET-E-1 n=1 Tax=Ceratocystis lukuohia TaxID=2019550 RepID=A0ABR4MD10_9PEZI